MRGAQDVCQNDLHPLARMVPFFSDKEVAMLADRIEIDPRVCGGKPVVNGTRIPVAVIIEQLSTGETWDAILNGYPELTRQDIEAALRYASKALEHPEYELAEA